MKQSLCHKRKVSKVMHEWKHGKLKTNGSKKVTNHRQAIAIALSISRRYCKSHKKNKRSRKRSKH